MALSIRPHARRRKSPMEPSTHSRRRTRTLHSNGETFGGHRSPERAMQHRSVLAVHSGRRHECRSRRVGCRSKWRAAQCRVAEWMDGPRGPGRKHDRDRRPGREGRCAHRRRHRERGRRERSRRDPYLLDQMTVIGAPWSRSIRRRTKRPSPPGVKRRPTPQPDQTPVVCASGRWDSPSASSPSSRVTSCRAGGSDRPGSARSISGDVRPARSGASRPTARPPAGLVLPSAPIRPPRCRWPSRLQPGRTGRAAPSRPSG